MVWIVLRTPIDVHVCAAWLITAATSSEYPPIPDSVRTTGIIRLSRACGFRSTRHLVVDHIGCAADLADYIDLEAPSINCFLFECAARVYRCQRHW